MLTVSGENKIYIDTDQTLGIVGRSNSSILRYVIGFIFLFFFSAAVIRLLLNRSVSVSPHSLLR